MTKNQPDSRAVALTRKLHEKYQAPATILFGSRARGNYDEALSDLDIMVITQKTMEYEELNQMEAEVQEWSLQVYENRVKVQVVNFDRETNEKMGECINSMANRARTEGVIFSQNPELYRSRYLGPNRPPLKYCWEHYEHLMQQAQAELDIMLTAAQNQGFALQSKISNAFTRSHNFTSQTGTYHTSSIIFRSQLSMKYAVQANTEATGNFARITRPGKISIEDTAREFTTKTGLTLPKTLLTIAQYDNQDTLDTVGTEKYVAAAEADIITMRKNATRLRRTTTAAAKKANAN